MTPEEVRLRGWDGVDIVLVTGDAYIDHPSFAMAVIGRTLESAGYKVAVLAQPDWRTCLPWRQFGKPRLFFAVSAGNVDSMINHYTANRRIRSSDDYSPGGRPGLRPDRASVVYCQRAREAYPGVTIITGGIEASMRRLAHYDYWSNTVKKSLLLDSKADLLVYGMGEKTILEIAKAVSSGIPAGKLRSIRGTVYALGASENQDIAGAAVIPSFEETACDKNLFLKAAKMIYGETNPFNALTVIQKHGDRAVVQNSPSLPLSENEIDSIYALPYLRRPHPSYTAPIPAFAMIKNSVTIHRGCFGGCSFCSLALHQGRIIQSRSEKSIISELEKIAAEKDFPGIISDMGGPTANMYAMGCSNPQMQEKCRRLSCLYPFICRNLGADYLPLLRLMRSASAVKGIKKALIASGIRMDLALLSMEYIKELACRHTGGQLKVAPEHCSAQTLAVMKKPGISFFLDFSAAFKNASRKAGKEQYLVPYLICGHPGSGLKETIELALFLKQHGYKPLQINDFIPAPMEISSAIYYAEKDPFTMDPVYVPRKETERKMQRALVQYFKKENRELVIKACKLAGRPDAIKQLL